ncbi:BACON domain-containing protein [Streptomyces sp. BBFR115]|uniref:BACON domain-containing protein n=1 Tax=Streptomyces sp. BBFR115 TaxID=3448173 RepID=UPI003F759C38
MSSSPETSTRTTGAHRAHREARDRAAARTLAEHPPACYEPHLDGLFTYCLSVLCDHEAATAALGEALACAERRGQRGPENAPERRAWLYALARWACLRRLAAARQQRQATHAAGRPGDHRRRPDRTAAPVPEEVQEVRRRELALLAWPEAAGTTPEQREALELAVRHRLTAHEVAAVLGLGLAAARELLASAACEVERTRAALAVVETGGCPGVAVLAGPDGFVLSTALRRELVRHVDDCPRCRRTAERAVPGRWPGACVTPAELPVLTAPRAALRTAMAHHPRARGAAPRFDRRGFPMDPKDRAARRDRLRARVVTTTVVATVVAAPVLALWAAYRGTATGEGPGGPSATAHEAGDPGALAGATPTGGYVNTADTGPGPGPGPRASGRPAVSVSVAGTGGAGHADGRLTVAAASTGDTTLVTLTASGPAEVHWTAAADAPWLYLSRSAGTLRPGETVTVKVYVDHLREPSGHWSARVMIAPARTVVTIDGYGTAPTPSVTAPADPSPSGDPHPTPTATTSPDPSQSPPTTSPSPTPPPTAPPPTTPDSPPPTTPENSTAPSPSNS